MHTGEEPWDFHPLSKVSPSLGCYDKKDKKDEFYNYLRVYCHRQNTEILKLFSQVVAEESSLLCTQTTLTSFPQISIFACVPVELQYTPKKG